MIRNRSTSQHRTILVTGGAGFIGSAYVRRALRSGRTRVVTLDALTYAASCASLGDVQGHPFYHFVHGDVRDRELLDRVLNDFQPSAVVHFAAETHVDRSIECPSVFLQVNALGTQVLLDRVHRFWSALAPNERDRLRVVHVSTDEVFGSVPPGLRTREGDRYAPNSPYAASKAAADHVVRAYHRTYGLPTIITHASNNYGPFQFPEKLIPLMITRAMSGQPLPVYGNGTQVRQWLYVEDHCRGIHLAMERGSPGDTYNLGGRDELSNLEIIRRICRQVDRHRPVANGRASWELVQHVSDRPGHDQRYALDSSKALRELGWSPVISLQAGLARTVRWYLQHGDWLSEVSGPCRPERPGVLQRAQE